MLCGRLLENTREKFGVPFHTLSFNVASIKAGKSHVTYPIRVRCRQLAVIWKSSE